MRFLFILLGVGILGSCVSEHGETTADHPIELVSNDTIARVVEEVVSSTHLPSDTTIWDDSIFVINYADFTIGLNEEMWAEGSNLNKTHLDSAYFVLELGAILDAKTILIRQNKYKKVEVFQQNEMSVTIMNEGPHCDLIDWKHSYSDWNKLKSMKNGYTFITEPYEYREDYQFELDNIQELKDAVKLHCGEEWANLSKNITRPNEYPAGVSRSRIILKFVLHKVDSEEIDERILIFEVAMGC